MEGGEWVWRSRCEELFTKVVSPRDRARVYPKCKYRTARKLTLLASPVSLSTSGVGAPVGNRHHPSRQASSAERDSRLSVQRQCGQGPWILFHTVGSRWPVVISSPVETPPCVRGIIGRTAHLGCKRDCVHSPESDWMRTVGSTAQSRHRSRLQKTPILAEIPCW